MHYFFTFILFTASLSLFSQSNENKEPSKKYGGTGRRYSSVEKATKWLAASQNEDGSWGIKDKRILSSYVMLCFSTQGCTAHSKYYGKNVEKLNKYLKAEAQKLIDSKKAGFEGAHILMALNEAAFMGGERSVLPLCTKLAKLLLEEFVQDHWPAKENELIHNLISVRSQLYSVAKMTASNKTKSALNAAINWSKRAAESHKGNVGKLINCYLAAYRGEHSLKVLNSEISRFEKEKDPAYFEMFLATKASFWKGGKTWSRWNRISRLSLNNRQNKNGSWPAVPLPPFKLQEADASVYNTAMAILCLTVYYRYIPSHIPDLRENSKELIEFEK